MDGVKITNLDFLNKKQFNLEALSARLKTSLSIDAEIRAEVLRHLTDIVANQEIEWLNVHEPEAWLEYLVFRYKFKYYPLEKRLEDFPLHLLIEPTPLCNLSCPMCFQSDDTFRRSHRMGMIDLEFFKDLIDQAYTHKCAALTLASRGEPTLHAQLGEMLFYCRGKFLELKLNTNAVCLNEELAHQILEAGVDIVVFSVDSYESKEYEKYRQGASFDKVLSNIERFARIRSSHAQYKKTATRIHGVYMGGGQSKEKFLKFWEDRVDSVVFKEAIPRWDTYNNEVIAQSKPCKLLWERMYVWFDGICNPCDFDYKSKLCVGNAKKESLAKIWKAEPYMRLRRLASRKEAFPCDRCNL